MSGYFGFTKLPLGEFRLYLVASDENPFDSANFGNMLSFNITNEILSGCRIVLLLGLIILMILF